MKLRQILYKQLYQRSWEQESLSIMNRLIFLVIFLSIFLVIVETEKPFYHEHREILRTLDFMVGGFFTVEYLLRVWSAGERKIYRGFLGRLKYMMTPWALLDLFIIIPFFVTSSPNVFVARILRLFRILAIVKAGRYSQAMVLVRDAVHSRRHELGLSLMLTCLVLLVASTVMWCVEPDEQFRSIPRALWWGIITLTTVGYGDVYPQTVLGKIISGITAIAGIGLIAMPAGILAAAFGEAINMHKHKLEERKKSSRQSRLERIKQLRAQRASGVQPILPRAKKARSTHTSDMVCENCGHDKFVLRNSDDDRIDFSTSSGATKFDGHSQGPDFSPIETRHSLHVSEFPAKTEHPH